MHNIRHHCQTIELNTAQMMSDLPLSSAGDRVSLLCSADDRVMSQTESAIPVTDKDTTVAKFSAQLAWPHDAFLSYSVDVLS